MRRIPTRYAVIAFVAVLAVLGGTLGVTYFGSSPSAKDRIEAAPPPALFPQAAIVATERSVVGQSPRAHELIATWFDAHGRNRDDKAFATWLEQQVPPPPAKSARAAELTAVDQVSRTRDKAGVTAATWLEAYGKKDLWKLYAHDQAELLPAAEGTVRKDDVKAMLKLSKTVADALGTRYQQSAPYVLNPSLRPDHTVTKGQVCPCSYPSRHAAAGAAATTYLAGLDPERRSQYEWTEAQIDWSRVYMAGHVPSDLTAGALLGDLIGEYYLGTRA
ncbi:MAG: phosphatase PAP2 family protein [Marmoricola sp.]